MCGLVGIAGDIKFPHKRALKHMLMFDTLRGEHSTGLLSVHNKKKKPYYQNMREVGTPNNLYKKFPKSFDGGVYDGETPFLLMGHNRFATQGKIDVEGAHPFTFPNLIGAHNGTIRQWSLRDFHGAKDYDIDSQILFSELSHSGDLEKVWKTFDGAASLTWYNRKDSKLNFIRNDERPMNICFTKDYKTMFWASEPWMLTIALGRLNITHTEIKETNENTHYQFDIDSGKAITAEEEKFEPKPNQYSAYSYKDHSKTYKHKNVSGVWPISLANSNVMLSHQKLLRLKLLKKVKDKEGLKSFLCDVTTEQSDKVLFQTHLRYEYPNTPNEKLGKLIEKSIKDGDLYHLTKEHSLYELNGISRVWYSMCCLDPLQVRNDKAPCKKVDKDKVNKLWQSPFNELLWKDSFEERYNFCENCHSNVFWEDRKTIKAISKESCLCEECSELPFLSHYMS